MTNKFNFHNYVNLLTKLNQIRRSISFNFTNKVIELWEEEVERKDYRNPTRRLWRRRTWLTSTTSLQDCDQWVERIHHSSRSWRSSEGKSQQKKILREEYFERISFNVYLGRKNIPWKGYSNSCPDSFTAQTWEAELRKNG